METSAQRCSRIAAALNDLAAQEAAALAGREFDAAIALQERAAPLVAFLAEHTGDFTRELVEKLSAVQARRAHSAMQLAAEIGRTREELHETGAARRRVAQIAPAYGRTSVTPSQLCAVG